MRYVWRAWVCLHIWECSRLLNPGLKKLLWSLFQQERMCSWHKMDMGSKSDIYELLIRILVEKSSSTVLLINALCGGSTVKLGDSDGRPPGGTFPPRQITNFGNRHKRAGCDSKVVNLGILKNWASNFLKQIPSWELVKNIQMPWTMIAIWCCKIWCYFGFPVWPGSSMFGIASRPFG